MESDFCEFCFKKETQIKNLLEQKETLMNALKQIELMGNNNQTKEAIFAGLILTKIMSL